MIQPISVYPEAFYRVSVKIIIRDGDKVLAVKENVDAWTLPGGGVDHGEVLDKAIMRELFEETKITQTPTIKLIGTDTYYRPIEQDWIFWIVAEATFDEPLTYGIGDDCTAVEFIDPTTLKESAHRPEQLVYKWSVDPDFEISKYK
ncbi:NUDIX domain-containing protein [Candidatus Saccharibacteria bacterium]|nr:NUDIX domain-containing protein [Candidatus Saccharibacteria bacterium]